MNKQKQYRTSRSTNRQAGLAKDRKEHQGTNRSSKGQGGVSRDSKEQQRIVRSSKGQLGVAKDKKEQHRTSRSNKGQAEVSQDKQEQQRTSRSCKGQEGVAKDKREQFRTRGSRIQFVEFFIFICIFNVFFQSFLANVLNMKIPFTTMNANFMFRLFFSNPKIDFFVSSPTFLCYNTHLYFSLSHGEVS